MIMSLNSRAGAFSFRVGWISVQEVEGEKSTVIELRVAQSDIGKVIGKYGRIAKALRTVLSASANKTGKRYTLEILD